MGIGVPLLGTDQFIGKIFLTPYISIIISSELPIPRKEVRQGIYLTVQAEIIKVFQLIIRTSLCDEMLHLKNPPSLQKYNYLDVSETW